MNFSAFIERISRSLRTPRAETAIRWLQRLFLLAVLIWLLYELSRIGWQPLWYSMPVSPFFYLLVLLTWFQLPLVEVFIYRISWSFRALKSLPAFLLKRLYNRTLLGYSGELYFFNWARKLPGLTSRDVFMTIKDNNIISSIASTLVAFGLILLFLLTGQIRILEWLATQNQTFFWAGLVTVVMISVLLFHFRHTVITMPQSHARRIFFIHTVRLLLLQAVNVLIYYIVIPGAPLHVWFTLISIEIILSRIPFLPNRDLIFIGLSIGLAETLAVSRTEIAGLMIARTVIYKLTGFTLATLFALPLRRLTDAPSDMPPQRDSRSPAAGEDSRNGNAESIHRSQG